MLWRKYSQWLKTAWGQVFEYELELKSLFSLFNLAFDFDETLA